MVAWKLFFFSVGVLDSCFFWKSTPLFFSRGTLTIFLFLRSPPPFVPLFGLCLPYFSSEVFLDVEHPQPLFGRFGDAARTPTIVGITVLLDLRPILEVFFLLVPSSF